MFNKLQIKIKSKGKLAAVNEKNFGDANSNRDKENIISAHVFGRVQKSSTHGQD